MPTCCSVLCLSASFIWFYLPVLKFELSPPKVYYTTNQGINKYTGKLTRDLFIFCFSWEKSGGLKVETDLEMENASNKVMDDLACQGSTLLYKNLPRKLH